MDKYLIVEKIFELPYAQKYKDVNLEPGDFVRRKSNGKYMIVKEKTFVVGCVVCEWHQSYKSKLDGHIEFREKTQRFYLNDLEPILIVR